MNIHDHPKYLILALILIVASTFALQVNLPQEKSTELRSRAAGENSVTVCPNNTPDCSLAGLDGIQQAIDQATGNLTINLSNGKYTTNSSVSFSGPRIPSCFINTKGKNITIKGNGAILDGENKFLMNFHGKDELRGGICGQGGEITLENIRINQTLGHAIYFIGSNILIKNVTLIDIDYFGIVLSGNSKAIIVNNFINRPLVIDGNSSAIVINNTFFDGWISVNLCQTSAFKASNNIISYTDKGIEIRCPENKNLPSVKATYNLVWKGILNDGCATDDPPTQPDCVTNEWCDFPGRITGNPKFTTLCIYGDIGWAPWNNLSFREGSAAIKAGDPAMGSPDLGISGGPCANGNSSECQSFIEQLKLQLVPPPSSTPIVPTAGPTIPGPTTANPTTHPTTPPLATPQPTNYTPQPSVSYYLPPTIDYSQPTTPPSQPSSVQNPTISYYLPPTINNQPTGYNSTYPQPTNSTITPIPPTPTITPTPKPLIDVKKTVEETKAKVNSFILNLIRLSQTILP